MKNSKSTKAISELKKNSLSILASSWATHGLKRHSRQLLKEIRLFENSFFKKRKLKNNNFVYVQIGGGKNILRGFLNIDVTPPADMICDVREGLPLKSNSAKLIFSEHFLEHLDYPLSVKKFMKDCHRVLMKNGQLIIGVPDGKLAITAYYKNDKKLINKYLNQWYKNRNCLKHFNTPIDFLNYNFRDQDDDKKYNQHFWAYDKEKLQSLFKEADFKKNTLWKFNPKIANPKRKFGSIYIVGVK